MAQSKNSPQRVNAALKRADALQLRAQGLTYAEIAEKLGCSDQMARKHVERGMASVREDISAAKAVFRERLETLIRSHWVGAISGKDTDSAALVLRLLDRQARLEGLDAPTKSESRVRGLEQLTTAELEEEARRLGVSIPEETTESPQDEKTT